MIFVTGDTHGSLDFNKLLTFSNVHLNLSKTDYMIIAGDFGAVWNIDTLRRDLDCYSKLPFTILFVDGNHENFDLLKLFPVKKWNGGEIHMIRPDIIHLMRGQVFEIANTRIFTFGGATSTDKHYRLNGVTYWVEETPTLDDLSESINNLSKVNYAVDYIITHTCNERALGCSPIKACGKEVKVLRENQILSYIEASVKYKHWYFGHFHVDAKIGDKQTALYKQIIQLT